MRASVGTASPGKISSMQTDSRAKPPVSFQSQTQAGRSLPQAAQESAGASSPVAGRTGGQTITPVPQHGPTDGAARGPGVDAEDGSWLRRRTDDADVAEGAPWVGCDIDLDGAAGEADQVEEIVPDGVSDDALGGVGGRVQAGAQESGGLESRDQVGQPRGPDRVLRGQDQSAGVNGHVSISGLIQDRDSNKIHPKARPLHPLCDREPPTMRPFRHPMSWLCLLALSLLGSDAEARGPARDLTKFRPSYKGAAAKVPPPSRHALAAAAKNGFERRRSDPAGAAARRRVRETRTPSSASGGSMPTATVWSATTTWPRPGSNRRPGVAIPSPSACLGPWADGAGVQRQATCVFAGGGSPSRPLRVQPAKGPVANLVRSLAPEYQLDPELVLALVEVESNFNPQARSPKDAQGLMQLIPPPPSVSESRTSGTRRTICAGAWPICAGSSSASTAT